MSTTNSETLVDGQNLLYDALTGWGWDERAIINLAGTLSSRQIMSFSSSYWEHLKPSLVTEEKEVDLEAAHVPIEKPEQEPSREAHRFINAVILWISPMAEHDARRARKAILSLNGMDLIEIACIRSSDELLNTRKAYQHLYRHSLEEDVASHFQEDHARSLLVLLVSSYRYESGQKPNPNVADYEANTINKAVLWARATKHDLIIRDEDVVMIFGTRNRNQLRATFDRYKELFDKEISEEMKEEPLLQAAVDFIHHPEKYFCKILTKAFEGGASEYAREGLTRVIVTPCVHVEMTKIDAEFQKVHNNVPLATKIKEHVRGNYAEFLLALLKQREAS